MRSKLIGTLALAAGMLLAATGAASPAFAEKGDVKLFLKNAVHLDLAANTVTLPVFRGRTPTGGDTWYIVTESSDRGDARRRGVNFAPKLANALGTAAVQQVRGHVGAAAPDRPERRGRTYHRFRHPRSSCLWRARGSGCRVGQL